MVKKPTFSPDDILRIGNLFAHGLDTWQIARQMRVPEHDIYNHLGLARARYKMQAERRCAPAEASPF